MPTTKKITEEKDLLKEVRPERKTATYLLVVLGFLLVVGYYFKQYIVAAMVNNKPIYRLSIVKALEKQGGQQAMDSLITQELILQEGQKKNVTVNDGDIDKKFQELEAQFKQQGQTLDKVLEAQGLNRAAVKDQLKIQITLEKLLGDKINVTDKELDEAYKQQKQVLAQEKDLEKAKSALRESLKSQKLSSEAQKLIEELKKSAKIRYFVTY